MLRPFGLHLRMLARAKYRIGDPTPVFSRANDFDIATDFPLVAEQQRDIVAAVAEVKPQRRPVRKPRLALFGVDNLGQRRHCLIQQRAAG